MHIGKRIRKNIAYKINPVSHEVSYFVLTLNKNLTAKSQ